LAEARCIYKNCFIFIGGISLYLQVAIVAKGNGELAATARRFTLSATRALACKFRTALADNDTVLYIVSAGMSRVN
jgi:hypothetical protein